MKNCTGKILIYENITKLPTKTIRGTRDPNDSMTENDHALLARGDYDEGSISEVASASLHAYAQLSSSILVELNYIFKRITQYT
jgi:hypothetical protein